ncbi:MAG: hypothetical protein P4L27_12875 [Ignavibacteriaceae bacterium]|nr:hypothetical protein [Ignavibacteriaceae bacterium]
MNNPINLKTFLIFLGLIIFLVISSIAMNPPKERYMVEIRHTPEECLNVLDKIKDKDAKLLQKMEWGCMSGDHTGYMVVNASSEQDALKGIPADFNAKAYKLAKFTPKQIEEFHKMKK